jgi:hypothetical protein
MLTANNSCRKDPDVADESWRKSDHERRLEAQERQRDDEKQVNFWLDPNVSPAAGTRLSEKSAEELAQIRAAAGEVHRASKNASTTAAYLRSRLDNGR